MATFIRVSLTNGEWHICNVDHVETVMPTHDVNGKEDGSKLFYANETTQTVRESVDDIEQMICRAQASLIPHCH